MISNQTFSFLKNLEKNNNKSWFEDNRSLYLKAKEEFQQFVVALAKGIGNFDMDIAELDPLKCIFRQNRDVRFSKDKSPYKIHFGAYFNRGSKKINTPGYYFHLQPGKSMIAAGWYQPEAPVVKKIRQEIDYNAEEWTAILHNKNLKKHFKEAPDLNDTLVRPPKGYEEDNPMLPYLKLKSFVISKPLSNDEILSDQFLKQALAAFKSLHPFLSFLHKSAE